MNDDPVVRIRDVDVELIVAYGAVIYLLVKYTLHCTVRPAITPRVMLNPAPVRRVIITVNAISFRRSRQREETSSAKIFSGYSHERTMIIVSRSPRRGASFNSPPPPPSGNCRPDARSRENSPLSDIGLV